MKCMTTCGRQDAKRRQLAVVEQQRAHAWPRALVCGLTLPPNCLRSEGQLAAHAQDATAKH